MATASPIAAARVQRLATAGPDSNKANLTGMPEGDSLAKSAQQLQVLVGEQVEVETPHPRASVQRLVGRLCGRKLLPRRGGGEKLPLPFVGGGVFRRHPRLSRCLEG